MKILVTGASGFVGRNLVENLKNIHDGKNRTRPNLQIDEIFEYDRAQTMNQLDEWCAQADFVFHLAGVNRPENPMEYRLGNYEFSSALLRMLTKHGNICPVMLSSSIQASLIGRFADSAYGASKRQCEHLFFNYTSETGAAVYVYRFPNLAGKWIRPNYNSALGTFCNNIAHDLPIVVHNPNTELELLFIDDLIEEMYNALEGKPHRCDYPSLSENIDGVFFDGLTPRWKEDGAYCAVLGTHKVTLGKIVELLHVFHEQPRTLEMPAMPEGSFEKKLYAMYLSYLPKEKVRVNLPMHSDYRGSFTEILKTLDHGQFSVNISKPGCIKGEHWHNTKWEIFVVVSGHGLIRERQIGSNEIIEFAVNGKELTAVYMLPGYTHEIINLSDTEDLVTLIWANETFDAERPDTFYMPVETVR